MKRLFFLLMLLAAGLVSTAQPLQRTRIKATQYLQTDTLKSINATSVSVNGNRITDMANPVDSTDAVNLRTMQDSIEAMVAGNPDTDDQTLSIDSVARRFTISITGGNSVAFEDLDTPPNGSESVFDSWDKNAADDFSGVYNDLTGKPDLNAKADTVWVIAKGYLTAIPATYVQSGDNVSELVNDAGYLTVQTDDQTLSIDSLGRVFTLTIEGGNSVNFEDQNTDNQTAAQVAYTNTTSGLSATDVQAAVDELDAAIEAAASGGVVSVNSKTGIVVLGTDDIAEGVTNQYYTEAKVAANSAVTLNTAKETNATHTGEVTGSAALTISNDVVDYARVDPTLKGAITDNDGAWDWSAAGLINAAISTNTTVTFSNLNLNKQLKIRLTLSAGAIITWPTYVTVAGATLGDGTFKIYADCWNAGSTTEDVFINIIAE